MTERTSDKAAYAVVIGRKAIFMVRPRATRQKQYREPVMVSRKVFRTKADALQAKAMWETEQWDF